MGYPFSARSGSSLYFEDIGSGPTVLALHGIGGGAFFFHEMAKCLELRYRILSVDLPGTGKSTSSPPIFSMQSWVADLGDLVSQKIEGPVVILGHSLGTILALKAWEAWPQWIRALIFVGGLPKVRPEIRERLSQRAEAIAQSGIAGWGKKVSPGIFSATSMRDQPETVEKFERQFEIQDPVAYVRSIEILLDADASAAAPTVRVPCLAMTGAMDSYAPPEAVRAFIRRIPGGCREEILPECAHMPFFEAPETFAKAAGDFLDVLNG